ICEEFFLRGFALSGIRRALGPVAAVIVVAAAFGIYHGTIYRLAITVILGLLLGLLVIRFRSLWPAMLAHLMHNGLHIASSREDGLKPVLESFGYVVGEDYLPPMAWVIGAGVLTALGLLICWLAPRRFVDGEVAGAADRSWDNPAPKPVEAPRPSFDSSYDKREHDPSLRSE
ncbi:MAG: CPBP family glutamic-type intramembrane protease, partial [Phycisphaerae bacterium]